jgi:NAD(P)-dependent dehydrogenase (short-subunit alcohol dehydrogenase family)
MKRWALISGAGSGIGRAMAITLADADYGLVLLGRNLESLAETRAQLEHEREHYILAGDVRSPSALAKAFEQLPVQTLHAVIANAGVGGENEAGPEDRWAEIIDTNLSGAYYLVNQALPMLRHERDEGDYRHILLISSILARLGVPGYTAYCASKAGMLGLMRSWAAAFAGERILVNALCPGWVDTAMARTGIRGFAEASGVSYEDALAEQMGRVPLGKMSRPEEVAALAAFLLSDAQSSITGQVLDINNGAIMPS